VTIGAEAPAGDSTVAVRAWRVVGASVRGSAHVAAGTPVEDAHGWARLADGRLVVAVADGAGSAPRAAEGAAAAVAAAIGAPDDPVVAAREALVALAEDLAVPIGDLASTLLVCTIGDDALQAWAVGDGAIVVAGADGGVDAPLPPERGEYRNETVFVTSDGWAEAVRTATLPSSSVAGLAVLSDGLELLALDVATGVPHPPFFAPLLQFAAGADEGADEELAAFLASPRVRERTDDDCTLVLVAPAP
jgi:hypothetical protein